MSEDRLRVVTVESTGKKVYFLPVLLNRLQEHATAHYEEYDPSLIARTVLARVVMGDPTILALAVIEPDGNVVGHAIGSIEEHGSKRFVLVHQIKVDPPTANSAVKNRSDIVGELLDTFEAWRRRHQAGAFVVSGRFDPAWQRKYGLKPLRTVSYREESSDI